MHSFSRWLRVVLCVCVILGGGAVATVATAGLLSTPQANDKLTPLLQTMAAQAGLGHPASVQPTTTVLTNAAARPLIGERGEALVYIRLNDYNPASLAALRQAGADMRYEAAYLRTVTARVAPANLAAVAALPAVANVIEMYAPVTSFQLEQAGGSQAATAPQFAPRAAPQTANCTAPNVGAATTEGVQQMRVDLARANLGLDGTGVKIGIISNSWDLAGAGVSPVPVPVTTAAQDIASGDLPGPGNPCGRTTAATVVAEIPESLRSVTAGATDEGRAMAQIVRDIAPGAQLLFHTGFGEGGVMSLADAVRNLRAAGADIIVDDVLYFEQSYFQDDPVAMVVKEVVNNGAIYLAAAGNSNRFVTSTTDRITGYEATAFRPTSCPTIVKSGTPITLPAGAQCHNFNPDSIGIPDPNYSYDLSAERFYQLFMQWGEPFYGVQTDFNVYITDNAGNLQDFGDGTFSESTWNNLVMQIPREGQVAYQNVTGATITTNVIVARVAGTGTPPIRYIMNAFAAFPAAEYRPSTNPSGSTDRFGITVFGHRAAKEVLSIAAFNVTNSQMPSFSSAGHPTIYFEPVVHYDASVDPRPNLPPLGSFTPANPLPAPETRQKPDVTASNNGVNTFFPPSTPAAPYRFSGTSAAAPHAAGVAGLVLQRARQRGMTFRQTDMERTLESTTTGIASEPVERQGAGLLQADTAAASVVAGDLKVELNDTPDPAFVGDVVTTTVTLRNAGLDATSANTLTLTLPTTATLVATTASIGSCSGAGPAVCSFGAINAGASVTVTLALRANEAGTLAVGAAATSNLTDPTPADAMVTGSTTIQARANLQLSLTGGPGVIATGRSYNVTATLANAGPQAASGAQITFTLPANVTLISVTPSMGSCSGTGPVVCSLGTLNTGVNATVTLTLRAAITGAAAISATAASTASDPVAADNSRQTTTTISNLILVPMVTK